jgi:hypothetical protein
VADGVNTVPVDTESSERGSRGPFWDLVDPESLFVSEAGFVDRISDFAVDANWYRAPAQSAMDADFSIQAVVVTGATPVVRLNDSGGRLVDYDYSDIDSC